MLFLLNSTPIGPGLWRFDKISLETAKELVQKEPFCSAIGHAATAAWLTSKFGVEVPTNRVAIEMKTGDLAIVVKLKKRLAEGQVLSSIQDEEVELGLLEKLA